jgi:ABC-type lipoprotein export system ATPase subunit
MYKLSGVVKNYTQGQGRRTVAALRGVDLVIEDGTWLAIQGPTGHGKSTLLQIIGGLDRPSAGTVQLDGVNLSRMPEAKLTAVRARSIGFIFQTFNLIPTLNEIIALMENLWREHGLTMVLVTHDSTVACRAQRIGLMKDGLLTVTETADRTVTQTASHPPASL